MASSTSSSSAWTATWFIMTALVITALGLYENALKRNGYQPSVAMNEELWSWHRMQAGDAGDNPVILLGASRMLLNISMPVMRAHYPGRDVRMLALNGRYPLAALQHLADDDTFAGTVLVSLNAQALEPWSWDMQGDYIAHHEDNYSFYRAFDAWLATYPQSRWRFANTELSLLELTRYFDRYDALRPPAHTRRARDLSIRADFSQSDHAVWQQHFHNVKTEDLAQNPPPSPQAWHGQVAKLRGLVDKITARGGEVILIRMPTSHGLWDVEEAHYPRATYWDYLARHAGAKTLHFADVEAIATLYLPDASHLDYRDRDAFTRALLGALAENAEP